MWHYQAFSRSQPTNWFLLDEMNDNLCNMVILSKPALRDLTRSFDFHALSHNATDWWTAHIFKTTWTWIMGRNGEFALFFTITIIASFVFRFLWVNRSIDMQFILSNIVCLIYWLIELKILSIEPYMSLHILLLRVLNGFFTHIINHSPGPCKVIPGENCFIYSSNRVSQVFVTVARWTRGSPDVVCVN